MDIKTALDNFDLKCIPLRLQFPKKGYEYTTVLENALNLDIDFIFIPLVPFDINFFPFVQKALENPHCKGFVINKNAFDNIDFKSYFHTFMKSLKREIEVLALLSNIYNFANYLGKIKTQGFDLETITITGTDEVSEVKDILVDNLSNRFNITYPNSSWNIWQKIYEPLLNADKNTKYAIIEAIPEKLGVVSCASIYFKNHIIFTKSSIYKMNNYLYLDDLTYTTSRVLDYKERVLSIHTLENNDFINDDINYEFQDKLHFVKLKNKTTAFERAKALAFDFLKYIKIKPEISENFKESYPLYSIVSNNKKDYFIVNPKRNLYENVLETIDEFMNKYKKKKKIVVFEHILCLGNYKDTCMKHFTEHLAKLNPDIVLFLNTNAYFYYFQKYNKNSYIKYLPYDPQNQEQRSNLKIFLNNFSEDNSAIYIASNNNLSFLLDGEN